MSLPLESLQGNIVKSFARPCGIYLFIRFHPDAPRVRPRLSKILAGLITSASEQAKITQRWKAEGKRCAPYGVGMFGLSAAGYLSLDRADAYPKSDDLGSNRFEQGLKKAAEYRYWDPALELWEPQYRENDIHAFLLLADDDPDRLLKTVRAAQSELIEIAVVIAEERACSIQPPNAPYDVEHFGFRESVAKVPDPESVFTPEPKGQFGCFAAFLKLEENVIKFRSASAEIAGLAQAQGSAVTATQIEELAIGRRHDGTPLVPSGPQGIDDFTFKDVPPGVCPMHAHIRAMNPRDGGPTAKLLRRGMTYGSAPGQLPPSSGVGLLFLSFQRSLLDFLFLLVKSNAKRDPILSRSSQWEPNTDDDCAQNGVPGQAWTIGANQICYPMADITILRGGEFFYVPSITFINNLT